MNPVDLELGLKVLGKNVFSQYHRQQSNRLNRRIFRQTLLNDEEENLSNNEINHKKKQLADDGRIFCFF